jgi:hypothetical protein
VVAKVEAAVSRNDSAKRVEPIGISMCRTPDVCRIRILKVGIQLVEEQVFGSVIKRVNLIDGLLRFGFLFCV